jgi:hypothetical protein
MIIDVDDSSVDHEMETQAYNLNCAEVEHDSNIEDENNNIAQIAPEGRIALQLSRELKQMQDEYEHYALRKDLIEHLWNLHGTR